MAGLDPTPWPADSADYIATAPAVTPTWRAEIGLPIGAGGALVWVTVRASQAVVTVTERTYPAGSCTVTIHQPDQTIADALADPLNKVALRISAGYARADLPAFDAPVFCGVLQSSRMILEAGDTTTTTLSGWVSYETTWQTWDALLDSLEYAEGDWTPPSPDVISALADYTNPPALAKTALPVRLSFTLEGFAAIANPDLPSRVLRRGDRLLDYLVSIVTGLYPSNTNMVLTVDPTAGGPGWQVDLKIKPRREFNPGTYWAPVWSRLERQADLTEASTGLAVSAATPGGPSAAGLRYTDMPLVLGYGRLGVDKLGGPEWVDTAPRQHLATASFQTIQGLTPAGGLDMYTPLVNRALVAAKARGRRYIITTRAAWWIKLRDSVRVTILPADEVPTADGVVSEYRFELDTGLMQTTIRTT